MEEASKPVEVYSPANSAQAFVLKNLLAEAGIAAEVVGATTADLWSVGPLATPKLLVHQADEAQARQIIAQWEQQERLHESPGDAGLGEEMIDFACDRCGQFVSFPVEMKGTVQECPHCGSFIDVPGEMAS